MIFILLKFIKKEPVLVVASLVAIISMIWVKPSKEYLSYIDFPVIVLLFCLMFVVCGLVKQNLFNIISSRILSATSDIRKISIILVNVTFISAMFITNDVALITLVPLTTGLLRRNENKNSLIYLVVMETIAANLGSMMTPFGNPQNLYLYSYYKMSAGEFMLTVLPLGISGLVLINIATLLLMKKGEITFDISTEGTIQNKFNFIVYIILFIICILSVFKVVDTYICFAVVIISGLIVDYKIFAKVDYYLLFTFCAFFVFVGNLGNIDVVKNVLVDVLDGKEFIVGVLSSQVISNVPAAIMLSGFTDSAKSLLCGVNVGGLGTLVASLASLISYKQYAISDKADVKRYLIIFTVINIIFLVILSGAYIVVF